MLEAEQDFRDKEFMKDVAETFERLVERNSDLLSQVNLYEKVLANLIVANKGTISVPRADNCQEIADGLIDGSLSVSVGFDLVNETTFVELLRRTPDGYADYKF